jgi:exonuclease VII small subunit
MSTSTLSFEASVAELKRLLEEIDCDPRLEGAVQQLLDAIRHSLAQHIGDCELLCLILEKDK